MKNLKLSLFKSQFFAFLVLLCLSGLSAQAGSIKENDSKLQQGITITGKVKTKSGEALPGVNINIEGTTVGTITDIDGNYTISVPDKSAVLSFSFIGYLKENVPVGEQTVINVSLSEDITQMEEVVVTALGIKREKKALTYASQQVGADELAKGKSINFIDGINGKIAGVQMKTSSAGAGGSTKVVLRGNRSLTGDSEPLYVIDGIPMINYQTSNAEGFYGGHDSGDGLSNINPDDIENISVLKGANAAALYGSQGANGVILITTKKGKEGKAVVKLTTSSSFDIVSETPDLQRTYGQSPDAETYSWGEKGSYKDYVDDFYETGFSNMTSASISRGNEVTNTYFSFANTYSNGVMPGNDFHKTNFTFNQSSKLFNDKLKVSSSVMLSQQKTNNRVMNGFYFNPITGLYLLPNGVDLDYYKDNYTVWNSDRNMDLQNWFMQPDEYQQNPYWIINKNGNEQTTKRLIASLEALYLITDDLNFKIRGNYDFSTDVFDQQIHAGTAGAISHETGRWIYTDKDSYQKYGDAMLNYNKNIAGTFDLHAILGVSFEEKVFGQGLSIDTDKNGLYIPNKFVINNMQQNSAKSTLDSRIKKKSVFGNVSLGYKSMAYIDISARNDWASPLAYTSNDSYIYPAVGLSVIPSTMFSLPDFISYTKLRASYSQVGQEVPAFVTNPISKLTPTDVTPNKTQPFTELKPEMQYNLEFGLEARFFENRLGFEATYYKIDNKDQFLTLNAPASSGYVLYNINAGHIRNSGFELTVSATPIETGSFTWNTQVNYSTNNNEIVKLNEDLDGRYTLGGGGEGYNMYIVEGGSFGDLFVNRYLKDESTGKIIVDDEGVPQKQSVAQTEKIGSVNPDFILGWNNSIDYKNWSLGILIDGKFGGKFLDMTETLLDQFGVSQRTADARDNGGVKVDGVLTDGTPMQMTVDAETYYTGSAGRNGILEPYVYDATTVRLRQLTLGYKLNFADKDWFIDNATLSLVGNNLFYFYKKAPYDPDVTIGTGNGTQSVENFSLPPTKSFGFSINLTF